MSSLIKRLKKLRAEFAFGVDGDAAALIGEAIAAIEGGHQATVQKCADAIVMCPECDCTAMSRKAVLALSRPAGAGPPEPAPAPSSVRGGIPTEAELATAYRYLLEKPSTSYIQRKMGIGYNHAAAIMETLENEGAVTAPDRNGKRTTLPRPNQQTGES